MHKKCMDLCKNAIKSFIVTRSKIISISDHYTFLDMLSNKIFDFFLTYLYIHYYDKK